MTVDPAALALGKAIAIRRVELGLSRNDLRDRSGLSYPYVAELERGLKSPSGRALEAIAAALDLRPHELLAMAEELIGSGASPPASAAPPPQARRSPQVRRPPPAPAAAGSRWFGPADVDAAPVAGLVGRSRRRGEPASGPLTEERVRQIVREELRRLLAEAAE